MEDTLELLDLQGLKILTAFMVGVAATAEANSSAVAENSRNIGILTEALVNSLKEIETALTKIETEKSDKPTTISVDVIERSWSDSTIHAKYPYECTIWCQNITNASKVVVYISPESILDDVNICPICRVDNGQVCIYSNVKIALGLKLWVEPGITLSDETYTCGSVITNDPQSGSEFADDDAVATALTEIYGGETVVD